MGLSFDLSSEKIMMLFLVAFGVNAMMIFIGNVWRFIPSCSFKESGHGLRQRYFTVRSGVGLPQPLLHLSIFPGFVTA